MPTILKVALDTCAVRPLLEEHGLKILRRVKAGEWEVYLPVIVYAEQAVWRGDILSAVIEGLGAQVIALERAHADALGDIWDNLRNHPRPGEGPEDLWRRHKCDWLIVGMVRREGWLLVSEDRDFQRIKDDAGIQVLKIQDFVTRYLS